MNTTFLHFNTADDLTLPALLFENTAYKSDVAAIFLHGSGDSSVFYKPEIKIWAEKLTNTSTSFFAFNNRGAHMTKQLKDRKIYGSYKEIIRECVLDIDGAFKYLKNLGYKKFIIIGHSTGANKAVLYNFLKPKNDVIGFVLSGPGDDTGLAYSALGKEKFYKAISICKDKIKKGFGKSIVPKTIYPRPLTYETLYDMINPEGDYNNFPYYEVLFKNQFSKKPLFLEFSNLKKPTLIIFGEFDEYCYQNVKGCMTILKKYAPKKISFDYQIVKDTNHGFYLKEKDIGEIISNWALANFGLPQS
jgi:pimeloyl-ACP methyl ester carboxylesterase